MKIKLGQRVRDSITGYEGVAICRAEWLYGCVRITIQGDLDKDGKMPEAVCIDEDQLIVIKSKEKHNGHKAAKTTGGSRETPKRHPDQKY